MSLALRLTDPKYLFILSILSMVEGRKKKMFELSVPPNAHDSY